ncbi:MAG TPA: SWIM zinc finger family protein [Ktedonobacteraceae bacterium]|nr:SWIM zinc finger family protein [Ktedonobacteraceae bacterium]
MSTILTLTEQAILTFVGKESFLKGQHSIRDEAIVDSVRQGMTLRAYCYGSLPEPYRVQVAFDEAGITTAFCSCSASTPLYGNRGCEHAAALLLMWQAKPEAFIEGDDLDTLLERCNKAELISFIKQLLPKLPDVEWELTMSQPTAKRKAPINPDVYRRQVSAAFDYRGDDWRAADKISHKLFEIKCVGDGFARQHDYNIAALIYEEIVSGILRNIGGFPDKDGEVSNIVSICIDKIDEALSTGQCDSITREKMFRTLFAIFHSDVEKGELSLENEASEVLLKHSTHEERSMIADWTYQANSQVQGNEWSIERHRQRYGTFLLSLIGEEITDELFLHICHETKHYSDAVKRLLALGRINEAVSEAGLASVSELLDIINLFIEFGHEDVTVHMMQERAKQTQNWHILKWLKQHYWAADNYATALELAESMFRIRPSIENYQDIRQLADHFNRWETLQPELFAFLEKSRNALVQTQIALDEGDIERALALVKSQARRSSMNWNDRQTYTYDAGYEYIVFEVARAAEDLQPRGAIEIYQPYVETLLAKRNNRSYSDACEYLLKIRSLYEKIEDSDGWINYLTDLRKRTNRLRSFKDELTKAGL